MGIILGPGARKLRRNILLVKDHSGAPLVGANLFDLDLSGMVFRAARLRGADFTGSNLTGCNFEGADLRGACLNGARCSGANLKGADMTGASAIGTDFGDARMVGAILERVKSDSATTWPAGISPGS